MNNDFLDNLGAEQYLKMHQPKKIKITPKTYEDMNEEFVRDGTAVRITIPTQEAIDKWLAASKVDIHTRNVKPKDMVQEMWDKIGGRPNGAG